MLLTSAACRTASHLIPSAGLHLHVLSAPSSLPVSQTLGHVYSACAQEFFQLLMRDMFDPDYGMFKLDEDTRMYWFRASQIDMSMEFELVGTMIGLAIYNSHLLEFSFPMLTYR